MMSRFEPGTEGDVPRAVDDVILGDGSNLGGSFHGGAANQNPGSSFFGRVGSDMVMDPYAVNGDHVDTGK